MAGDDVATGVEDTVQVLDVRGANYAMLRGYKQALLCNSPLSVR